MFGQNGIDIMWNEDQNVKLVKQLMTGIRIFVQKWHNIVIPPTEQQNDKKYAAKIFNIISISILH